MTLLATAGAGEAKATANPAKAMNRFVEAIVFLRRMPNSGGVPNGLPTPLS